MDRGRAGGQVVGMADFVAGLIVGAAVAAMAVALCRAGRG